MSIEAMKQALDALEEGKILQRDRAITALRTAIEQAEKRWSEFNETTKRNIQHADWYLFTHSAPEPVGVVKVLPLGEGNKPMHWADWTDDDNHPPEGTLLYTTPPAAIKQDLTPAPAAPVLEGRDWSLLEATKESLREHMAEIKRLKAAQRQWVGLTDEEVKKVHTDAGVTYLVPADYDRHLFTHMTDVQIMKVSRAIEAKLKEKNT